VIFRRTVVAFIMHDKNFPIFLHFNFYKIHFDGKDEAMKGKLDFFPFLVLTSIGRNAE
jgi:hypothetical protein